MKSPSRLKTTLLAGTVLCLIGTAASVNAQTLVNWGGNEYINNAANTTALTSNNMQGTITSGSQVFTGLGAELTSNYHQRNGLDTTFIPIATGVNGYNSAAHQSGVFYGAFENVRTDSTTNLSSAGAPQVRNAISAGGISGADSILFNRQLGASANNMASNLSQNTAMILWRDWVNAGTYTYGDLTNFSVNMTNNISSNSRLLVQTASGYYLNSGANLFTATNGLKEFDAAQLAALEFTAYDPIGTGQFFTATSGLDGTVDLSEETIIGIGLWNTGSASANWNWGFDSIEITAIPEPSTFAALLGLAGLALVVTRRRRAV